jgi:acetoin utilization deacetylase AcuC-like enzyme
MFFLVSSDRFADHLTPPGHPDRPARAHVMDAVASHWAANGVRVVAPRPASVDELVRVHSPEYVERIFAAAGRATKLDRDTFTSPATPAVSALAAGAAIVALDECLDASLADGRGDSPGAASRAAVVLTRPPGHHVGAARPMGFGVFNAVAIAAAHALARGLERVAIVDYDVHHGNGTEREFYGDPRVLYISTHQFPFYPGTGSAGDVGVGDGTGFTVNVPIQAGATDGDYRLVFERVILPVLASYDPQVLLVSAGFDAHVRDPLADMRLSARGFDVLARCLRDGVLTRGCPAVFVTEGGYHLKALGACLNGLVETLSGRALAPELKLRPAGDREEPDLAGRSFSLARHAPLAGEPSEDPLTVDDVPFIDQPTPEVTGRGAAAADLVCAVQGRYWPKL